MSTRLQQVGHEMVLGYILISLTLLVSIPVTVFFIQVVAAVPKKVTKKNVRVAELTGPIVCLLMPAHNEASGISEVLHKILPQLGTQTRLLVVADNCLDDTTQIAREIGRSFDNMEVIERHDPTRRGKGYALEFGVLHLEHSRPDVVLIVDADCELERGAIEELVRNCVSTGRPTQGLYLMKAPHGAGIRSRLAEFAWIVKNQVRPLGFHRLGLPCQLTGTGMAFKWDQIRNSQLGTGQIVEDMQLGIELTQAGHPPLFCPEAIVISYFPSSAEGLRTQRTRWEHGHLGMIFSKLPKLFTQAAIERDGPLFAMATDLCVPPLAFLTLALVLLLAANAMATVGGVSWVPFAISGGVCVMFGAAILISWFRFGREAVKLKELCLVPIYILAKIPLYAMFAIKRQAVWVRSKRDGEK